MPYTTTLRPLTEKEQQILLEWMKPVHIPFWSNLGTGLVPSTMLGTMGAVYGGLVGLVVAIYHSQAPGTPDFRLAGYITLAGFIIGMGWGLYRWFSMEVAVLEEPVDPKYENVEVSHYTASAVVSLEVITPVSSSSLELQHVAGYVFQIDPRMMVMVSERDVDAEDISAGRFPCATFEIVRFPRNDRVMEVICTGPPLTPRDTMTIDAQEEWRSQRTRHLTGTLAQLAKVLEEQIPSLTLPGS